MSAPITRKATTMNRMLSLLAAAAGSLLAAAAQAAAPGIGGNTITLSASPAYLTQPDGLSVYSWGYGCTGGAPAAGPSLLSAPTPTPLLPPNPGSRPPPGGPPRPAGTGAP